MKVHFKIERDLYVAVYDDLVRSHQFAAERLGFLVCKPSIAGNSTLILAQSYLVTPDDWYVPDPHFASHYSSFPSTRVLQKDYIIM